MGKGGWPKTTNGCRGTSSGWRVSEKNLFYFIFYNASHLVSFSPVQRSGRMSMPGSFSLVQDWRRRRRRRRGRAVGASERSNNGHDI